MEKMWENKKIRKMFIAMFIFVVSVYASIAYAETKNIFKAKLTADNTSINSGDSVTLTLQISDIDMGEDGINVVEGTLNYDKDIFEKVLVTDFQDQDNWQTTYNSEDTEKNGKFLSANLSNKVKENTNILKVTLKTKKDLKESKKTTIEIKDITSNNGKDLINIGNCNVKIKINSNDNTVAVGILPKAGVGKILLSLIVLTFGAIAISIIKMIKTRDIK